MSDHNADYGRPTILAERLIRAIDQLGALASNPLLMPVEAARLQGKIEGVKLALSYLEERKRELLNDGSVSGPER